MQLGVKQAKYARIEPKKISFSKTYIDLVRYSLTLVAHDDVTWANNFLIKNIQVMGSLAQWLAYLLPDPATQVWFPALPKKFQGKIADAAEINQ